MTSAPGGAKGCAVDIEVPPHDGVSTGFGIETRLVQEIEGDDGKRKEAVPLSRRVVGGSSGANGNEVVLAGAHGTFRGVPTVCVWWCKLEVHALGPEEGFEFVGGLLSSRWYRGWKPWSVSSV
jgi:hypothetical protein